MDAFTVHKGLVAPMDRANVDTDAIIPKQFLKSIHRSGFGPNLFDAWRYLDPGEPGQDPAKRKPNPDFVLNQPRYQGASVLIARDNFGCGSSREHAPWALEQYGFRAIIAPSFADIFFNNCFKNGVLPIRLSPPEVETLLALAADPEKAEITVDLEAKTVIGADGKTRPFDIAEYYREMLLQGLNEISATRARLPRIEAFERGYHGERPWLPA